MNVSEQIADIRERLMRVETLLDTLQKSMAAAPPKGSIVIPVTVVTAVIQGGIAVLQHFA